MEKEAQISPTLYYDERSAGGIVYKIVNGKPVFLLIKTFARKNKRTIFKFPKGHLKDNEVLKQAAQREVEEEGRVKTKIVAKIGSNDYIIWDKLQKRKIIKKVTFFLMEYIEQSTLKYYDTEIVLGREWMEFAEATHRLAFDSEKVLLQKAKWKLDQVLKSPTR